MNRLRWAWQEAGAAAPVTLAALLVVVAVLVQWLWLAPARTRLALAESARPAGQGAAVPREESPARQLERFYAQFDGAHKLPAQLARLHQIAQANGIVLRQGEYKLQREADSRLVQYRIVLPVQGPYLRLRRFMGAVLEAMPALALDQVSFERKLVGEEVIEAQMRFTLFLRDDEGPSR